MTDRVVSAWRQAWPKIMVVALIMFSMGTCVNFVLIGVTMSRQGQQAADGAAALARSCRLAGVSKKVYVDNLQRRVITADDFALFTGTLQAACSRR